MIDNCSEEEQRKFDKERAEWQRRYAKELEDASLAKKEVELRLNRESQRLAQAEKDLEQRLRDGADKRTIIQKLNLDLDVRVS